MGTWPAFNFAMRSASTSVQMTSCPASARQAPVTRPTYPQPITVRRTTFSLYSAHEPKGRLAGAGFCKPLFTEPEAFAKRQLPGACLTSDRFGKISGFPANLQAFLSINKPRSPSKTRRGWRRMTFHKRRVDSSRLISPSDSRVASFSRSTSCE